MEEKNAARIRNAINDPKVEFCFVPSNNLRNLVLANEHPFVKALPDLMKGTIIDVPPGIGIGPLDKNLVMQYVFGTIDERHKFLFDSSEIRTIGKEAASTKKDF